MGIGGGLLAVALVGMYMTSGTEEKEPEKEAIKKTPENKPSEPTKNTTSNVNQKPVAEKKTEVIVPAVVKEVEPVAPQIVSVEKKENLEAKLADKMNVAKQHAKDEAVEAE